MKATRSNHAPRAVAFLAAACAIFAVPVGGGARAEAQEIEWRVRDVPVEASGDTDLPHVEPHVAVNARDAGHVVIGSIVVAPERTTGPWRCAAHVSFDGGGTWRRHDFAIDRCIDPWVVFIDSSTVLFTATEITREGSGDQRFRLALLRSEDGGRTWTAGDVPGRTFEHAQLVRTPGSNDVLMASRRTIGPADSPTHVVEVARSRDEGRTFTPLAALAPGGTDVMVTGIVPVGTGALITYRNRETERGPEQTWSSIVAYDGTTGPAMRIPAVCTDGSENVFAGYPSAAGDGGLAVHACVGPGLDGVRVSRSEDGGRTWQAPVRADASDPTPHARTPMLAVSGRRVAVAWYDRRNDADRDCQDVYLAVSDDGGSSFGRPVRVTAVTSCPRSPGNGSVADSWPMGGDYGALAATPDGAFRLVWADSRSGAFSLRTAVFSIDDG